MGEEREYWEQLTWDKQAAQKASGYTNVRAYYDAIKGLPRTNGVLNQFRNHVGILEGLDATHGNMYYGEKDELFVGAWSIETPEIFHRHKELGAYFTMNGMDFTGHHDDDLVDEGSVDRYKTHIQWDAAKGECGLCGEQMPGEILMMHKFYQF